jgi:hypothetical protein
LFPREFLIRVELVYAVLFLWAAPEGVQILWASNFQNSAALGRKGINV